LAVLGKTVPVIRHLVLAVKADQLHLALVV
jgi:hypothetical protein